MLVQLNVNDSELPAFMNILNHLKSGIIESVSLYRPDENSFIVSSADAVRERVAAAEERGSYLDHETFWKDI